MSPEQLEAARRFWPGWPDTPMSIDVYCIGTGGRPHPTCEVANFAYDDAAGWILFGERVMSRSRGHQWSTTRLALPSFGTMLDADNRPIGQTTFNDPAAVRVTFTLVCQICPRGRNVEFRAENLDTILSRLAATGATRVNIRD